MIGKNTSKIFLTQVILFVCCISLYGVKATVSVVNFLQPDGTVIPIKIYGDEFFSYKKDMSGFIVEQGDDGFLYYADYNAGKLNLSESKITSIPFATMQGLRERGLNLKRGDILGAVKSFSLKSIPFSSPLFPKTIKTPVLLVEFSDVKFTVYNPVSSFSNQLNNVGFSVNGATGSASDYFNDNFTGRCNFIFDVFPIVISLPKPKGYYGADSQGLIDAKIQELSEDICREASNKGLNFSKYDWLEEGILRNVSIVYSGYSQAETGVVDDIWPQYYNARDIDYNGKKLSAFSFSSELSFLGLLKGNIAGIGTFCHEFAHSLGLPDMYDTNGDIEGAGYALFGRLSIMDEGNYLNYGRTPPYFTAIERELIGDETTIPSIGSNVALSPIHNGGKIYRINSSNEGEYFLIECRTLSGWDRYINGEGMVVYHVDKSMSVYGGLSSQKRWEYNNINCYAKHQCATVFTPTIPTASDLSQLFFPGLSNTTSISSFGNPRFLDWNENPLEINISELSFSNGVVRFNVVRGQSYNDNINAPQLAGLIPYQNDCFISWTFPKGDEFVGGDWRVRWGSSLASSSLNELRTKNNYCYISMLKPQNEYIIKISFEKNGLYGKELKVLTSTLPITSDMPYMVVKGEYKVGDIIGLRILNCIEESEAIEWYVNSERLSEDIYEFKVAGRYNISGIITYKDGSQEKITKRISVK